MPNKPSVRPSGDQAAQADPHELYELSVQCAEAEIDFVDATWKTLRERPARLLREDFCGSALVCAEWIARHKRRHAIGVDLDPDVLAWGRERHLNPLPAGARRRIELRNADVLTVKTPPADIILAMNFSYWLFKQRHTLKRYFQRVHAALRADGIFFLDAYGGYDAFREIVEEREIAAPSGDFTYIWEQASYNPIDASLVCHIHFAFADGSRLERAFSYAWRLWTLAEIRELLIEAGFRKTTVYWQGFDENGEADGVFVPAESGDADAGWICYLGAEK